MLQRRTWQHDVMPLQQVSAGLKPLTSSGLADIYETKIGSDASSHSDLLIGTSFTLTGVSKHAVAQLSGSAGQQLQAAIKVVGTEFELATAGGAGVTGANGLLQKLQDMHCCIVALDDSLDEQHLASGGQTTVDDCRQWLKQLQEYVLHLTKQVQACTSDSPASDASSISSMDEAGSHTSSTAGTAAADATWRMMCQDAAEVLNRVADQMESGGATSSDFDSPRSGEPSTAPNTKLVAQHARLSYSNYWAKKIAL